MRHQRGCALLLPSLLAAGSLALAPSRPMAFTSQSWTPARETAYMGNVGWQHPYSPAPTEPPKPNDFGAIELFKRFSVGSDTCGFISGFSSNAVTCVRVGAYCTNDGSRIMACCTGDYASCVSTMPSSCVPFSASSTDCTSRGARTMCCGSAAPSCYSLLYTSTSTTFTVLECQTYGGIDNLLPLPPVATSTGSTTTSSSSTSSSSSSSSTTISSTTTTSSAPASTTATSDNGGGSSTPVGAIVGGTVGGVAAIAAISLFAFWMIVRRRRNAASTPYQAVQQPQPGGPGYPSPGQEYPPQQYGMGQYTSSMYKTEYGYQPQQGAVPYNPQPGGYPYPPSSTSPAPGYPPSSTSPGVGGQPMPPHQQPTELPVQFAVGSHGNRAELPH